MSAKKETSLRVVKVVLSEGRIAYLRELKIADTQLAAKAVGKKAGNNVEMALAIQNELLKLILIQINDDKLTHVEKNNLDDIISIGEHRKLMKVLEKMSGDDDQGEEPEMEITTI